jgi:site-specific recombinase XerD
MEDRFLNVAEGKTGERDVALLDDEVVDRLDQIRKRHTAAQGGKLDPTTSVFVGFSGAPTGDVKKAFGTLLKACAFQHSTAKDYCQYSLRHLYATDLVGRGCQDGILAKLMGTSREMIQDFYDHATVAMAKKWVEERERAGRHLRRPGEDDELKLLDPDLDNRLLVMGKDGLLRVEVA